jgi:hypothetical protein
MALEKCGNEYRILGATDHLQVRPDPEGPTAGRNPMTLEKCGNEYRVRGWQVGEASK